MQKGWVKANNKYYYLNTDGKMVVGQSLNIDGYIYTFDAKGIADTVNVGNAQVYNASSAPGESNNNYGTSAKSSSQSNDPNAPSSSSSGSAQNPGSDQNSGSNQSPDSSSKSSSSSSTGNGLQAGQTGGPQ